MTSTNKSPRRTKSTKINANRRIIFFICSSKEPKLSCGIFHNGIIVAQLDNKTTHFSHFTYIKNYVKLEAETKRRIFGSFYFYKPRLRKERMIFMRTAIVPDTNVLVHDPKSIDYFMQEGRILIVPWITVLELDHLKDKPDIGLDARDAMSRIENLRLGGAENIFIKRNPSFNGLSDLDRKIADHQIIATAKTLRDVRGKKREFDYEDVRLVSRDRSVRVLAREVGVVADDYYLDRVPSPRRHALREVNVEASRITKVSNNDFAFIYEEDEFGEIEENGGVICYSDFNPLTCARGTWEKSFVAIRKGGLMKIIPREVQAAGLRPFTLAENGKSLGGNGQNWSHQIALGQLLDPDIELVFLQGGAGTGKTLLAVASAIEQRSKYHQIVITRPMVHLDDEDNMGFLPGDESQKMSPWLRPIYQALNFLSSIEKTNNEGLIKQMLEYKKIVFEPLDYIRGMTYHKTLMIIDDSQNITPHQAKTIITRAGVDTKIIFTGDLGQIDRRRRLDERSSGLTHSINSMRNKDMVGITTFQETVRSKLAKIAEECM